MPVVKGEQDQPEAEQVQICPEELPEAAADPGDLLLLGRAIESLHHLFLCVRRDVPQASRGSGEPTAPLAQVPHLRGGPPGQRRRSSRLAGGAKPPSFGAS